MPAMLDDPSGPAIYRVSGEPPYPQQGEIILPDNIQSRQVTLRDRITIATLLPVCSPNQVPPNLLSYLSEQLNREIEIGDTYPMVQTLSVLDFAQYWFQNFSAIMVMGDVQNLTRLAEMEHEGADWSKLCLGSFYVKPNYPGRSSHICNGGFLVTDAARNKGVGRLMGEGYLDWAPRLGYTYSVFNLVYETNVASCRIWDALGFKRIGRVKGAGNLKSHPDEFIDGIIYGRDLGPEGEDFVSEERFDKIRYYLKHSKYPAGADRAEKSRLRSAATHYKLVPSPDGGEERLMLKDKEVVSDPQRQYEIARQLHAQTHGGINKTTASIAERYHWVRIKETVSLVIKNCPECKESSKTQSSRVDGQTTNATTTSVRKTQTPNNTSLPHDPNREIERLVNVDHNMNRPPHVTTNSSDGNHYRRSRKSIASKQESGMTIDPTQETISQQNIQQPLQHHSLSQHQASVSQMHPLSYNELPLDPQIMTYASHGLHNEAIAHALDHHAMAAHQSLGTDHNLAPHPHTQNLSSLSLDPHGLSNNSAGLQGHGLDQSLQGVDQNMHGVGQSLGHTVDHHGAMHVNLGVMGHNGFDLDLGTGAPTGVGVGTDDRMDAETEDGALSHHLMEAGFGGPGSGNA